MVLHEMVIRNGTIRKLGTVSYSSSIVTIALFCIISEIKRDIGRKSRFSYHLAFDAAVRGGGSRQNDCHIVWYVKITL